jgi:hypothetical protein
MTMSDQFSSNTGADSMEFEAVYYSGPAPRSQYSFTLLALVFDRIHFPGVYVPTSGVDLEATAKELQRLRALPSPEPDTVHMMNLMAFALRPESWKDICAFTGQPQRLGVLEPGARHLAHQLEEAVFGPPPENFIPTVSLGFSKGLVGDQDASVNAPSWLSYPAGALLYAARTGATLVNDNPHLPVPGVNGGDVKANARQLATIMALESVRFLLPDIRPMSLEELAEFRTEVRGSVRPFRRAMLRLSKDLNSAILSEMSLANVQREARFLVETMVAPELEDLKSALARPSKPWHRRVTDLAAAAPELIGKFATLPPNLAVATTLAKIAGILADVRDAQLEREGIEKRGGFHYLLALDRLRTDRES